MLAMLFQWFGFPTEGYEFGSNESLKFRKEKCLTQLNAYGKKKMMEIPDTICHKLYLRDVKGEPTHPFDFCIPPFSKYLVAEKGIACGVVGFWIRDRNRCMKTFAPGADEKVLKNFMRAVGFLQWMPFSVIPPGISVRFRLVFISDSCVLDKKGKILKCEMNPQGIPQEKIYPLSHYYIPNPLYEMNSRSTC